MFPQHCSAGVHTRCMAFTTAMAYPLTVGAGAAVARHLTLTHQQQPKQQSRLEKHLIQDPQRSYTAAAPSKPHDAHFQHLVAAADGAIDPTVCVVLAAAAGHELSGPCTLLALQQQGLIINNQTTELAEVFADTLGQAQPRQRTGNSSSRAGGSGSPEAAVMAAAAQHDLAGAYTALLPTAAPQRNH